MSEKLIEQARHMLIQKKVGLISEADLVNWADEKLKTVKSPPEFLVSISMGESLAFVPRLDLVQYPVVDDDCPQIAHLMLNRFKSGDINADQVVELSLKMCQELNEWGDYFQQFNSIDDEFNLVDQGIFSESEAHQFIIEVLEKIASRNP